MHSSLKLNPSEFKSGVFSIDRLMEGGLENELGLVIPDYQRDYTWEIDEVQRLFNDLLSGLSARKKQATGTFFGASVWCKRKRPKEDEFLIASYDIVDGQQRITSCLLLSISLMFEIKKIDAQIEHNALAKDLSKWLKAHVDHIEQRIIDTVVGELKRASQPFSRLIHEEDTRGKSASTSEYLSPLALIQQVFARNLEDNKSPIDFSSIKVKSKDENVQGRLINNIELFCGYLCKISDKLFYLENNIPFLEKGFLLNRHLKELFLEEGKDLPEGELRKGIDTNPSIENLIRLIQFYGYFFNASCFSIITCEDEDSAFSIFDSLNTTGVPLTAIETLKPYVQREYRQLKETFDGSEADKNLKSVDEAIRAKTNDTSKQSMLSKELVIHSVLLGNGAISNNSLTTQRNAIREMQQKCSEGGYKELTSKVLKTISDYRLKFSSIENIRLFNSPELNTDEEDDIKLVNAFLSNTNTRLYRPILARFYWDEKSPKLFLKACKAIAAFYVLRRSTSSTTERIDDIFRNTLAGTNLYSGLNLMNRPPSDLNESDLEDFKTFLKTELSTKNLDFGISDKDKWVSHVKDMNHFSGAKFLLRFMLFAAHDGAKVDSGDKTLLQRDDATPDSSLNFLSFNTWDNNLYETLEHVAPQKENTSWKDVYDDPNLKHTIGNFVLLPKGQNSSLQDSDWAVKKLFLKILLLDSHKERSDLINKNKQHALKLPPKIEQLVLSKSSPLVKSHMLSGLENIETWDADYIRKRSERLCSLAWDKIVKWLE